MAIIIFVRVQRARTILSPGLKVFQPQAKIIYVYTNSHEALSNIKFGKVAVGSRESYVAPSNVKMPLYVKR